METIEDKKQFAVLIDSDNISAKYASSIFNEIENYGYASFRRIYGNWSSRANGWKEEILLENQETCVRIPMWGDIRSLNLSNSVAIVLYEALRQNGFAGLQEEGQLHRLTWKE